MRAQEKNTMLEVSNMLRNGVLSNTSKAQEAEDIKDGVDIMLANYLALEGAHGAARRIMQRVSMSARVMVAIENATVRAI